MKLKPTLSFFSPIYLFMARWLPISFSSDWPMWRHDANRSGGTPEELPSELYLHWIRENPPLRPAWPEEPRMIFDESYEPIVIGKMMVVGSSYNDSVAAFQTDSGAELWRFYADGPIHFAPIGCQDCIYFTFDDVNFIA